MSDVLRLREALARTEEEARSLSWNKERPWKPETHIWEEGYVGVVDLHDLSIKLALSVVATAAEVPLETGAVHFITGRGRHNIDGRSRLREAVTEALLELSEQHHWGLREPRGGRITLITNAELAPPAASGGLDWWVWALSAGFLILAIGFAPLVGIPLALVAIGAWLWSRKR
ncbi:MAG TPA: hypothetical protein QGF58_18055 [Myxococcota bacterium]|nr:hypothetical protein [Myxococcota bacterium]